jgi:DnaJ-domain-containing protein 1
LNDKDYFKILDLNESATHQDINTAYKKLAVRWHPEKHPNDRLNAQNRFNQINEAYLVLSDPAQKHHYDIMKRRQFTMSDAEKIFEKFFEEFGIKEEKEKEFFSKNYPARKPSYYEVLGVPKTASFADLQKAYRKLAVKYHPSANHGDAEAEKKFIEINEAYSHLCNVFRRRNYSNFRDMMTSGLAAKLRLPTPTIYSWTFSGPTLSCSRMTSNCSRNCWVPEKTNTTTKTSISSRTWTNSPKTPNLRSLSSLRPSTRKAPADLLGGPLVRRNP